MPTSPTGGPPDRTPPQVISTDPKTGTTNFSGNEIVLNFSEYVQRKSLRRALKIEPRLSISHSIDWSKRSVTIKFNHSLPDSTTLIVTLGTDFSDLHGNTLGAPYEVAISTGPNINKGELVGRLIVARTGKTKKGKKVLLYRKPVDLSEPASYIAETDTGGVVHFSYLSPGIYKAFWVDDINRNGKWDPKSERAQPFNQEFVKLRKAPGDTLQHTMQDTLGVLYIANSDTSAPELLGVGLFSSRRLRLRFSENIFLTDSTHFILRDSSTHKRYSNVFPLYLMPGRSYVLFAHSQKPLSPDNMFSIEVKNISDGAGNVQPSAIAYFTGSAQKDTTLQRLIGSSVGKGIFPSEPVQVAYAAPITKKPVRDSLYVVVGDSVHSHWKGLSIHRNKVSVAPEDSVWNAGKTYIFQFWNPAKQNRQKVKPNIWHSSDLGSIHIFFSDSTSKASKRKTVLHIKNNLGKMVVDTTFTGEITVKNLAPMMHQVIIYQDLNGNGSWDPGTVSPFRMPEPYFVRNKVSVKSGFTGNLPVSFDVFYISESNADKKRTG